MVQRYGLGAVQTYLEFELAAGVQDWEGRLADVQTASLLGYSSVLVLREVSAHND